MAGHGGRRRRGGDHGGEHEGGDERWLLSYADMMTLLVALFMVLFSISSVNKSKLESLQKSLKDAFSGHVLPGGTAIKENGGSATDQRIIAPPVNAVAAQVGGMTAGMDAVAKARARQKEAEDFKQVKAKIDSFVKDEGIAGKVSTRITKDGLHIRILTDDLLFASGSAVPSDRSLPLLAKLGTVLADDDHPIVVDGHTDSAPIHTQAFPSNWELSGARASAIVRAMVIAKVKPDRLTAQGRAYNDPIASNSSPGGRAANRRVEILLPRQMTDVEAPRAASTAPGEPPVDLSHPLGTRIVPRPATEATGTTHP